MENDQGIPRMTLDGMDTAKFRVPRNIVMTKKFSAMTGAEFKLTGMIAEGISKSYNLVSDEGCQFRIVIAPPPQKYCETLSWFQANGRAPPDHLRIHSDNETSEAKNQVCFFWSFWLSILTAKSTILFFNIFRNRSGT